MKNEKGTALLVVLIMFAVLMTVSGVALRMTLLSGRGNSQAKTQLQQEADQLPALKP